MAKLTEAFVASVAVPQGKNEILVFDDQLPGFGVRVLKSGRRTLFVKYEFAGRQRKVTLGVVTPGTLAEKRREADRILSKARLGHDTSRELKSIRAKPAVTLAELMPRYLAACRPAHKPRSFEEKNRHLTKHWSTLHQLAPDEVTRKVIIAELDRIADRSGTTAADRAKASLSAFFAWLIEREYVELNPVVGLGRRAENGSRDRVLSEAELVDIWKVCDADSDYGRITRLLILTGSRREEIGGLRWSEIDLDRRQIELPPRRTKNKRPHVIPLASAAIDILQGIPKRTDRDLVFGLGGGGFSGWSQSKARFDARLPADMAAWRLHDIRRSFVTHIAERGFAAPHVIEALVNHVSGSKAGIAGVYNKAVYAVEKRQAVDLWADHLTALVDGRKSNVIPIASGE